VHVIVNNDGSVELQFLAASDQAYTVEYSADLVRWSEALPSIRGTGSPYLWHDDGPPGTESLPGDQPHRFYRIRVEP